jgi:hypothetical protein
VIIVDTSIIVAYMNADDHHEIVAGWLDDARMTWRPRHRSSPRSTTSSSPAAARRPSARSGPP